VQALGDWFADREELYRAGGVIAPRGDLTGEPQHDLLSRFGRDAAWTPTRS
jgi:hypothetical protein